MYDLVVIGSGMGSLSAAALLAKKGLKILIIEQNWIPGGCTSSYWRKGFVFESGATTLVGMDKHMALRHIVDETGIEINMRKLDLPMQVHMKDGSIINRYEDIEKWIDEAKNHFDGNQADFWSEAYQLSKFVWEASTKYKSFPPRKFKDFTELLSNFSISDIKPALNAFKNTKKVIEGFNIKSARFQEFVNEQLLITAQNHMDEVNFLFGAASLCYTNYSNYYVDGGLINMVKPIVSYIEKNNGEIVYRKKVESITRKDDHYIIRTGKSDEFKSRFLISGIPVNNLIQLDTDKKFNISTSSLMESKQLNSAFQMGIGFKSEKTFDSLHHQIHLSKPLPIIGSTSIFVSLNHPDDKSRADEEGQRVASVSTHIPDPENTFVEPEIIEKTILQVLEERGFLSKEDIVYVHSSAPKSWSKWTNRQWGFVGGYPQFSHIKPWQMIEARLDQTGAYIVGDTAYPGQGIPGTSLSGIIAAHKLQKDWL